MMRIVVVAFSLFWVSAVLSQAIAQGPGRPSQGAERDLIAEFDQNENGRLEKAEREEALADLKKNPQTFGRGKKGGKGRFGRGGRRGGGEVVENKPGRKIKPSDVTSYPSYPLYDDTIMRTFFIDFDFDTWESDMAQLKDYGVDIGATVTVDEKQYKDVGVRFRGNSSFFSVREGQKRSLNLTFDWADEGQEIYGYRTLNLLNSHADASFLRSMLYSRIAGQYTAVAKANFVHVVINGLSWGVYINEQQLNSDFTKDNFATRKGARFKAPPGRGVGSFSYQGDDKAKYTSAYEIKSKDKGESWERLINATKILDQTPVDEIETVDEVFSIDRALWFLAVDNVLLDMDGYYERGADFVIYQEPKFGRTMILPYDNNETFRTQGGGKGAGGPGRGGRSRFGKFGGPPGGGPPGGGPPGDGPPGDGFPGGGPPDGGPPDGGGFPGGGPQGGPDRGGQRGGQNGPGGGKGRGPASFSGVPKDPSPFALDIFSGEDHPGIPIVGKLLKNPEVRARYVAHVRTIHQQWIDWKKVKPLIEGYRNLIGDEVKQDTRKLTTFKAYQDGIGMGKESGRNVSPGLKAFFKGRKSYLDKVPELKQLFPEFESVEAKSDKVVVKLKSGTTQPDNVYLYWATDRLAKYRRIEMHKDGEVYSVDFPIAKGDGKRVFYYVEARTDDKYLTTSFYPAYAESRPLYTSKPPLKPLPKASSTGVVISEVMASNKDTFADAQGQFGDWIELANTSEEDVDLSGLFLSDSMAKPKKFRFPDGTKIKAGGFLVVFADGKVSDDGSVADEIHTNFKLSKDGETVLMARSFPDGGLKLLDSVEFGGQTTGRSWGRIAAGGFGLQSPTPGKSNFSHD